MTKHSEVKERRREMTILVQVFGKVEEVADKLAGKYDVRKQTIQSDWSNRDEWLRDVWEVDDPEQVLDEALVGKKRIIEELWKVHKQAKKRNNVNQQLGALGRLDGMYDSIVELMQSLGEIHKEPEKLEHEVNLEQVKEKLRRRFPEEAGPGGQEDSD